MEAKCDKAELAVLLLRFFVFLFFPKVLCLRESIEDSMVRCSGYSSMLGSLKSHNSSLVCVCVCVRACVCACSIYTKIGSFRFIAFQCFHTHQHCLLSGGVGISHIWLGV